MGFTKKVFVELNMELTIDQALQKGVEAHKAGQVQEADRLYTATLKAQPKHPDANHNMGVLAVGVGKVQEALPFFKTALEANPSVAQFWLSYIDTLIKLERLAEAKAVLDQAKSSGSTGEGFAELEQTLKEVNKEPLGCTNAAPEEDQAQPNILESLKLDQAIRLAKKKANEGSSEGAKRIYQDILVKFPKNKRARDGLKALTGGPVGKASKVQQPPQDQQQSVINLYNQGQLQQALEQVTVLLQQFPNSSFLYNICGAVYKELGQLDASIEAYKKSIAVKPDYEDAWNNIGSAFKSQGKLEEAIEAYNKALAIKPDYAVAHNNMGNALKEQGKLEEAIEAFNKALAIKPNYAKAYNNVGNSLKEQGKLEEAIEAYKKALAKKPDYTDAYNNIGIVLQEQGKLEEAIEAYRKVLAIKPDYGNAKHMLSSLTGKTTSVAPREYVENLFDGYANKFEHSLVGDLAYNIPKTMTDLIVKRHGCNALGSILDLGCGTGLTGLEIKEFCSNLEGIDLSNRMLELARDKGVYDKLSHVDIVEYLSQAELNFDYFISTDVFVYLGDLSEVFRFIKTRNKKPGKLVFSTEHAEKDGFHIEKSARYSHSKSYIDGLCKQFNYRISHFSQTNLRKEKGEFLTGGIYLLDF